MVSRLLLNALFRIRHAIVNSLFETFTIYFILWYSFENFYLLIISCALKLENHYNFNFSQATRALYAYE